jgi:hypothetical protein
VHGVLRWRTPGKRRRVLVLRFQPHHATGEFHGTSDLSVQDKGRRDFGLRLSPLTHELMAPAQRDTVKSIVAWPPRSVQDLASATSRL